MRWAHAPTVLVAGRAFPLGRELPACGPAIGVGHRCFLQIGADKYMMAAPHTTRFSHAGRGRESPIIAAIRGSVGHGGVR